MFRKKSITIKYYIDRNTVKKHIIAEDGKSAIGKILPVFDKKTGKFVECEYCSVVNEYKKQQIINLLKNEGIDIM